MPKRPSRECPRERKASEDLSDEDKLKKKRRTRKPSEDVTWVKDTTLTVDDDEEDDDSSYVDDGEQNVTVNINVEGKPTITIGITQEQSEEESGDAYEEFLSSLLKKYGNVS
jgi:hypothetical protein